MFGAKFGGDDIDRDRPSKRRRVPAKATAKTAEPTEDEKLYFPKLFNGAENDDCVRLRQKLYEKSWASVDARIQVMLQTDT